MYTMFNLNTTQLRDGCERMVLTIRFFQLCLPDNADPPREVDWVAPVWSVGTRNWLLTSSLLTIFLSTWDLNKSSVLRQVPLYNDLLQGENWCLQTERETETEPTRDAGVKKQWKLCWWSILMVGGLGTTSRSLHQVQDSLTGGGWSIRPFAVLTTEWDDYSA